jgi:hypothetical protein
MKNVKQMLDPKAILNPYKTLPEFWKIKIEFLIAIY